MIIGTLKRPWDETAPQQRATALTALLPANSETTMGWDGKGHQDVLDVQPEVVTVGAQGQARVRVDVLIRSGAATPPPAAQWVALEVPVDQAAGRIEVTGQPGLIGLPSQGPSRPRITTAESDTALSSSTQTIAEAFFKAYAAGSTTTATAPGAEIPPLPAGIEFKALTAWSVDRGDGSNRTGTARVSWSLGGAAIEQTYRVKLTRVSSADAATWQVAGLYGGAA